MKLKMPIDISLDTLAFEIAHESNISSKTLSKFVLDLLDFDDTARERVYKNLKSYMEEYGD